MRVLLASSEDVASMNIKQRLLEISDWERISTFQGRPVYRNGSSLMFEKEGLHLDFENVDVEISKHIKENLDPDLHPSGPGPLDLLVFLSKHRSEMAVNSLTVHVPGNYGEAKYGGRPNTLSPCAPKPMSDTLRALYSVKKAHGIKDRATFEVTHHGPYVSSPSFFIEIGSDNMRWGIPELGNVIAEALISVGSVIDPEPRPVCVGIGGGHYAPRFSDLAIAGKVDMGHMIADHDLEDRGDMIRALELAVSSTPGVGSVVCHRTSRNSEMLAGVEDVVEDLGLRVF